MKVRRKTIRWIGICCLTAVLTVTGIPGLRTGAPALIYAEEEEDDSLVVIGLTWDESDGTAYWDKNENARYYQVRLYRNGSSVGSTHTTKERYYEFEDNITRKGDYYFEVRATGQGTTRGPWATSYEWYVTSSEAEDLGGSSSCSSQDVNHGPGVSGGGYYYSSSGTSPVITPGVSTSGGTSSYSSTPGVVTGSGNHWCLDQYGWWYQFSDGTYPRSCWLCIDDRWYCFNESGYIRYGWIQKDGNWYYCGSDGALLANTRTPDGYYVGEGGIWIP